MLHQTYDYQSILAASERVHWRIEDLIGEDKPLDFERPFLPESLAQVEQLSFLTPAERRALNQIRGHNYLYLFGLVEEFILPFVLDHARPQLGGNDYRTRAFLRFASEEAKHIHLFKRFREAFEAGFGQRCEVIGPAQEIARAVLAHHPLGIALVILHLEWMTQRHYLDSVKDEQGLDQRFTSLLQHHWMEEAQHAKLDVLMVEAIAADLHAPAIAKGFEDYLAIATLIDTGLKQQVEFDVATLAKVVGRRFSDEHYEALRDSQLRAMRWTFLGSGMTHPSFLATVEKVSPAARARIETIAPSFC